MNKSSAALATVQQHRNLSDRVAHHLMDHIRTNRLASGERLPSEVQLSADLKISRGIVREAYRALKSAGILEISNGRSPRVGALRSTSLIHLLQHALATQQASPEQALDLRSAIEVRAAELAAEKRSEADIDVLNRAVRGMKRARRNIDAFVQHDVSFHECLGTATGNPLFAIISSALGEAMATSVRAGMESRSDQAQVLRVVESHQDIVDAITAKDPKAAGACMERHFDDARRALSRAREKKEK
ncbi:MAG: FadR family transcriptional regulator [Cyanobacteria bacterium]|nr:FadR family transcriptional regulator [Cyanobacteriota bacterium]